MERVQGVHGCGKEEKGRGRSSTWLYREEKGGGAAVGRAQATDGHGSRQLDGFQEGALESEKWYGE
jgi:hypothetical protein